MHISAIFTRMAPILIAMTVAVVIEMAVPFRNQSRSQQGRLQTNIALLIITLLLGTLLNLLLAVGTDWVRGNGWGVLQSLNVDGVFAIVVAIVVLDFSAYLAHVSLHKLPWLWRMHVVHHSDPAIDATTALRQHPFEGVVRFAFTAAAAWSLGVAPEVVALYRLASSLNSVLEHANIRVPRNVDRLFVTFFVTPDMHKVHHSRERRETDSNYANLLSLFDRLFGTFTPSVRAAAVRYGLDGFDETKYQSVAGALLLPLRRQPLRQTGVTGIAANARQ